MWAGWIRPASKTPSQPAAYLSHWIELLKKSPKVLFQVLSEARQAADLICPEVTSIEPAAMLDGCSD